MTIGGTVQDRLGMAALDQLISAGQIGLADLSEEQIFDWVMWEPDPVPLTSFCLADPEQREAFLYQYCWVGETALFAAVSHIWDSLTEPRKLRCTLMGAACGSGGKGKMALVQMLHQFFERFMEAGGPMPLAGECDTIDTHHEAAMNHFENMAAAEQALVKYYAGVLGGAAVPHLPVIGI
jgi:hypothetical protein